MEIRCSKEEFIMACFVVILSIGVIIASPVIKEILPIKSVNETIVKSLNVSNIANSNIVENKTESTTTSEVSSLLPQIVNNFPTILGISLPLIFILLFRKDIKSLLNRKVTSVEIPGIKIGIADYPDVINIGRTSGIVWGGRITEIIRMPLLATANISKEEIKMWTARINKTLGDLQKVMAEVIDNRNQPSEKQKKIWKKYAKLHYDLGYYGLHLADIYNLVNKKDTATQEVVKAKTNLENAKEALLKVNPDMEKNVKNFFNFDDDLNKKFLGNVNKSIENLDDLNQFLRTVRLLGVCKHLEAYIYDNPPLALNDALSKYEIVLNSIKNIYGEEDGIKLLKKIEDGFANKILLIKNNENKINRLENTQNKLEEFEKKLINYLINYYNYKSDIYFRLNNYNEAKLNLDEFEEILEYLAKYDTDKKRKVDRLTNLYYLHLTKGEMISKQNFSDKADQEFWNAIEILERIRKLIDKKEFGYDIRYNLIPYWWKIKNKYEYAKRLYENGLINESKKAFRETIEIFEGNKNKIEEAFSKGSIFSFSGMAQVYYDLGLLYLNTQDPENAEKQFEEAIKILPEDPELHIALGNVKFSNGENENAIKEYDLALRYDSSHPIALLNREAAEQRRPRKVEKESGIKKESGEVQEKSGKDTNSGKDKKEPN